MGYINDDRCLKKAKEDEPIFVILGRDPVACSTVLHWITESFYNQPEEKLREAFEHCLKMRLYPKKFSMVMDVEGFVEDDKTETDEETTREIQFGKYLNAFWTQYSGGWVANGDMLRIIHSTEEVYSKWLNNDN